MKKMKKLSATVIALLLALTTVFSTVLPVKAASGPSEKHYSYIRIGYEGTAEEGAHTNYQTKTIFESSGGSADEKFDVIDGISYDKNTNTLTITTYNQPTHTLEINNMGDDFKIKLAGDSSLLQLIIWASGYDCGLELMGSGKLSVNPNGEALSIMAHHRGANASVFIGNSEGKATLKVSDGTTLVAKASEDSKPVFVQQTTNTDCIVGTSTPAMEKETYSYNQNITCLLDMPETPSVYDELYTKAGDDDGVYAVKRTTMGEDAEYVSIYRLAQLANTQTWISMSDWSIDSYNFNAESAGLVSKEGSMEAYYINTSIYAAYETAAGGIYSLDYASTEESGKEIYNLVSFAAYGSYKDKDGKAVNLYTKGEAVSDKTYSASWEEQVNGALDKALAADGYTRKKVAVEGAYNLFVTGNTWTLTGHTHSFGTAWKSDASSHWNECEADGEKNGVAAHTFKEVIDSAATTEAAGSKHEECTICGYKKAPVTIEKLPATTTDKDANATVAVTNPGKVVDGKVVGAEVSYTKPAEAKANVTVPDTVKIGDVEYAVTTVDKNAFKDDKKITTVTVGENVKTIDSGAFSGCKNLKTVNLGKNVETVGDKAFQKCTSLKKVTVPSTVTKVGKDAFSGCTKMTSVTIGANVKSIGANAFSGDKKLKTITIKSTKVPTIGKNAFKDLPKNATIKVPKKLYKDFKKKLTSKTGFKKTMKLKKV